MTNSDPVAFDRMNHHLNVLVNMELELGIVLELIHGHFTFKILGEKKMLIISNLKKKSFSARDLKMCSDPVRFFFFLC